MSFRQEEADLIRENQALKDELSSVRESLERVKQNREELAELCHDQWSGWMKYLFGKVEGRTIPSWAWDRWQRQAFTEYSDLSNEEKESDRKEADRFIALLTTPHQTGEPK